MTSQEYFKKAEAIRQNAMNAKYKLIDQFVQENKRFKVGDVIRHKHCPQDILRIDSIRFCINDVEPTIRYHGQRLANIFELYEPKSLLTIYDFVAEKAKCTSNNNGG